MEKRSVIDQEKKTFTTMDIYLGAYIVMHGIEADFTQNGQKIILTFPITDELYKTMADFNSNKLVPVVDYITVLKTLKARMFAIRGRSSQRLAQ